MPDTVEEWYDTIKQLVGARKIFEKYLTRLRANQDIIVKFIGYEEYERGVMKVKSLIYDNTQQVKQCKSSRRVALETLKRGAIK